MPERSPVIEFKNVSMRFGALTVHRDLSFKIYPGESVTLLGPSGVGKTLVLKMIMGLLVPSGGEIMVMGAALSDLDEAELQRMRAHIGMVFQGAALFDSLSVFDNIAYPLREARKCPEEEIKSIVQQRLEVIGLPGIGSKYPGELSGGQKKRVGLARALATSPEIVLFDEPTTGLDPTAIRLIDDLIVKLHTQLRVTAISVTHDIESARRISQRWLLINNGTVAADGPVDTVAARNQDVVDFITGNWRSEISLT
jgi:phospholipid/cholesterol/gamma-HCH transport system ATP-binding protein